MRLLSLQLHNFRQFRGTTPKLALSVPSSDRNVVLFHGSNGSGKTALLNAFTWGLYGAFTRGFQYPDQLVNKMALRQAGDGGPVEAWVEIGFEHADRRFILRRTVHAIREPDGDGWMLQGDSEATLQWCGPDGKWETEERVADALGRILPEDLHSYFFFDGERIERIVQATPDEEKALGDATKKLVGVEVLVRAESHLNTVRRRLEKEYQDIGDPETQRLLEKKRALEEQREQNERRREELERNIEGEKAQKNEVEDRLRRGKETEHIQQRRDELNRDQESRQQALRQMSQELAQIISSEAYAVFVPPAIASFRELIEGMRKRGDLPAGIKRQFVDDLLSEASCICERPLEEYSTARSAVERWKERAGLADVEEKAIRMGGEVTMIEQAVPRTFENIDRIQKRKATTREELSRIQVELDDIKEKLKKNPKEEISSLETRLSKITEAIDRGHREQGELARAARDLDDQIGAVERSIDQHQVQEERQKVARDRVDAARDARDRIREVRRRLDAQLREKLLGRLETLFRRMSVTPYVPHLTDDWGLQLLESAGGTPLPVAASQGESQILSLAFIASIIEQAREMQAKRDRLPGPDGAVYPIVMDSPFGSLDPNYRHQVAEHLPRIADQLLLLVTQTQWRGEVARSMSGRLAHTYVLTYFTPRDDVEPDEVEIGGRPYSLVRRSPNEFEYTEIVEVTNG